MGQSFLRQMPFLTCLAQIAGEDFSYIHTRYASALQDISPRSILYNMARQTQPETACRGMVWPTNSRRGALVQRVTDYDRAHFVVYLRLLDARAAKAALNEMALESHLKRAQRMTTHGRRNCCGNDAPTQKQRCGTQFELST